MIPVLIAKLVGVGIPARLAKPLLIAAAVIGAGLILWLVIVMLVRNHDAQVIERHDAAVNLEAFETKGRLDELTADLRVKDAIRETKENAAIQEVIKDAPDSEVSDARRAVYRCRELQRKAREAGLQPPRCL